MDSGLDSGLDSARRRQLRAVAAGIWAGSVLLAGPAWGGQMPPYDPDTPVASVPGAGDPCAVPTGENGLPVGDPPQMCQSGVPAGVPAGSGSDGVGSPESLPRTGDGSPVLVLTAAGAALVVAGFGAVTVARRRR